MIFMNGSWSYICGHKFWNNQHGAKMFCEKLGYSSVSVSKESKDGAYGEDSFLIGECLSTDKWPVCSASSTCNNSGLDGKCEGADCTKGNQNTKMYIKCDGRNRPPVSYFCTDAQTKCKQDNGELRENGLYCMFIDKMANFDEAQARCRGIDGSLPIIKSADENSAVKRAAAEACPGCGRYYDLVWLDLMRVSTTTTFRWTGSGKEVNAENEQFDTCVEDYCTNILAGNSGWDCGYATGGKWRVRPCKDSRYALCQI